MSNYRITQEQRAYLDSLVCQRISNDPANLEIIEKFQNNKGTTLHHYMKKFGWSQDKKGSSAYYIVKEPGENGEPLLFFSLRCGEVVYPLELKKLRTIVTNSRALLDAAYGKDAPDWAKEVVEKRKVNGVLPAYKFMEFYNRHSRNLDKWENYTNEILVEGENIVRAKKTFAGVELVHFCVHTPAQAKWEAMGMGPASVGKTMFWKFVVPVIQQIRSLVGCEYLYLFAADQKSYGRLVKYYKELGFEVRDDLCVFKEEYDFSCFFMCQKVTSLRNRQNEFYRNYNRPKEPEKG